MGFGYGSLTAGCRWGTKAPDHVVAAQLLRLLAVVPGMGWVEVGAWTHIVSLKFERHRKRANVSTIRLVAAAEHLML